MYKLGVVYIYKVYLYTYTHTHKYIWPVGSGHWKWKDLGAEDLGREQLLPAPRIAKLRGRQRETESEGEREGARTEGLSLELPPSCASNI